MMLFLFQIIITLYFGALVVHAGRSTWSGNTDILEICCHVALLLFLSIAMHTLHDEHLNQQISASTAILALSASLVSFIFGISLGRSWTMATVALKKRTYSKREKTPGGMNSTISRSSFGSVPNLISSPSREESAGSKTFVNEKPKLFVKSGEHSSQLSGTIDCVSVEVSYSSSHDRSLKLLV
jgi:hypothetical protein